MPLITSLHNLDLFVHLGVPEEERKHKQKIKIVFKLQQSLNLECLNNDDSNKYICYTAIAKKISEYCDNKEFKLLEYLCYQIYKIIKENTPEDTRVCVVVEKLKVKILESECIAKCKYSDFIAH